MGVVAGKGLVFLSFFQNIVDEEGMLLCNLLNVPEGNRLETLHTTPGVLLWLNHCYSYFSIVLFL